MKFKEIRSMSATKLRSVCIAHNWYTCGTNEEYGSLLDKLTDECGCPVHLTTEKLVEIAEDIWDHSEITEYTIESVLCELEKNCYAYFDVVE